MPLTLPGNDAIREILVQRIDHQKQAVGIVAGVIDADGRRVIAHGHLAAADPNKADSRPLDDDTVFEIGSVTKVFTALLLADMANRHEVSLEDAASKYLPAHVRMPEHNGKSITLLDLATHTSGLPRLPTNLKPKNPRNPYADYTVDNLYEFLSTYELPRDPGSEFEYSNLGGGLLGHILALRAGTDYETLIRTRITGPLNMPDTGIALSPSMQQRMATGHTAMLNPTPNWDLPTLAGAGALRSSANDMLTFLEAFLRARESDADSPLAAAMKTMLEVRRPMAQTPSAQTPASPAKGETGLGWIILSPHGREIAAHDGGTGGFRSWIGYDPSNRTGVVVLSNAATTIGGFDIGMHLLDRQWPLAKIEPPQQRTEIQIDPQLLDHYTGRYQMAPELVFEVTRDASHLFGQTHAPAVSGPKFQLFAETAKKFFAKVSNSQITFETAPTGSATSLTLHKAGRDIPAPRLS
ncbi:MAG TPA: serine hydrolase [Bryobacteraceae bacterium]|jgi:CubicO group peptidase (beta-lactamase class C family)